MAELIFVLGTGRSGTHLIGRSIGSHPQIEARIEEPETFSLITHLASSKTINSKLRNFYYRKRLISILKRVKRSSDHTYILEKSHPTIWLTDIIKKQFPNSKFVGVRRDAEPTISSMLRHKGVLSWFEKLPNDKTNPFIGVTDKNKSVFSELDIIEKCYLRWKSHTDKLNELNETLGDSFLLIDYDKFVQFPENNIEELSNFLKTDNSFDVESIDHMSLNKWEEYLNEDQKLLIKKCRERFD